MNSESNNKSIEELAELINIIELEYNYINKNWQNANEYVPINMKKKKVEDVYKNEKLLNYVFNYRKYINDNISEVIEKIQNLDINGVVNTRVKAYNSIQYKIQNYEMNHEHGKIPLKKCLNDIFGLRIIQEKSLDYDIIKEMINQKFQNLKCIKSIRGDYNAIHIYFGNDDNYKFQWELQVWDKEHEKINLDSHFKYKQDYTKWEQENI